MKYSLCLTMCLFSGCLVVSPAAAETEAENVLAEYVHRPDASYHWEKRSEGRVGTTEYVELRLTSQTWHDIVWKHQLFLIHPKSAPADASHALLFITGGSWRDELEGDNPSKKLPGESQMFAMLAERMKTPIAVLLQVPRQPIFDGKYEDQIISYTFEQYARTGDSDWPLLLPMVKSAVRAMDAFQEAGKEYWQLDLKTFTVSGASKRGWTTWLTGAVDPRATAIAPMVIDMLNMAPQMKHQVETFGDYSEMIHDYTERGLQKLLETPAGNDLRTIVDPYSYRDHLTQPKLILLGTNDPYWPVDALNLYWNDLVGPKYILYVPNRGHGLDDYVRVVGSVNAFHQSVAAGKTLPKIEWKYEETDQGVELKVTSDRPVKAFRVWSARSASRDFRPSTWEESPMQREGDSADYHIAAPVTGYTALFGECEFAADDFPYYFSTTMRVLPPRQ